MERVDAESIECDFDKNERQNLYIKFYNKNLESFSRETSLMFFNDAKRANYKL